MGARCLFPGFILVVALLSELSLANMLHVSIVFRHGVRTHLSKNSDPLDGEGEARLLVPEGGDEARRLGNFIRNTYLTTEDDSMKISQSEPSYTSIRDAKIVSSNLVRTTSTAAGFADGLYPDQAVPVTISGLEEDDFLIRAYTKCPNFSERLNDFYASEEFQNKEQETREFRNVWAPAFSEPTTLENWWNVFDKYNLALNYGSHNGRDVDVPEDVSLDEARIAFPEMKELAEWVELRRYSPDLVADDVGGRLLGEIVEDIRRALDEGQSPHRITAYSAHYPTILSLVSTMSGEMIGHIPDFGEAVIVELHDSGLRLGIYSQASNEVRCP
uniref:Acid phosphatase n=1 Tax=Rhodosorus marinus TaxID=101924 RepID=A0A7S3E6W9_9RHOD|mmetsp:Transcript_1087/g.2964  ORF Transcript_1087/g.2964 Transcript_1087/m.2964 type:complete len:330 (+) Transcript_1087:182-1171(+)